MSEECKVCDPSVNFICEKCRIDDAGQLIEQAVKDAISHYKNTGRHWIAGEVEDAWSAFSQIIKSHKQYFSIQGGRNENY